MVITVLGMEVTVPGHYVQGEERIEEKSTGLIKHMACQEYDDRINLRFKGV